MQSLKHILSRNLSTLRADGRTETLTGLSASTSNDNVISGLPNGHGIEVGDRINIETLVNVTFINYRIYARRVIEIQDDLSNAIQETDTVPAGLNGTYDLEVAVDGGGPTAVSFTISPGDTWADVVSAVSSGLTTASLAATAFFNSPSTLWSGGVSTADAGILIRSDLLGTGSSINISNGTVNDFLSALSAESYSYNVDGSDSSGLNLDIAISIGYTWVAGTYNVSGPVYNGTFGISFEVAPGAGVLSAPLSPDLFTTGYTTQNSLDLSNSTAVHTIPGDPVGGSVTAVGTNDVTYTGDPANLPSITELDRIRKHYIANGNIGIGTDEPQYPFDVVADLYYKGNRLKKSNFTASAAPISSDDSTQGYEIDSTWVYNGQVYVCTDANPGNAVWNEIGSGGVNSVNGDGGPDVTLNTDNINEGSSNLYYTDTRFDNRLATKDTDDLPEGATNLYFSGKDTDDLPEGATNLYFSQDSVRQTLLTGLTPAAGVITDTDTVRGAFEKLAPLTNLPPLRLIGRGDTGTAEYQQITLGGGFSMAGTTLNFSGGGVFEQTSFDLVGNANDLAIGTQSIAYAVRTGAGSATITSIQTSGNRRVYLYNSPNTTGYTVTLVHQSGSGTASNRILSPYNTDFIIPPEGYAELQYDTVASRWRILSHSSLTLDYTIPSGGITITGGTQPSTKSGTASIRINGTAGVLYVETEFTGAGTGNTDISVDLSAWSEWYRAGKGTGAIGRVYNTSSVRFPCTSFLDEGFGLVKASFSAIDLSSFRVSIPFITT